MSIDKDVVVESLAGSGAQGTILTVKKLHVFVLFFSTVYRMGRTMTYTTVYSRRFACCYGYEEVLTECQRKFNATMGAAENATRTCTYQVLVLNARPYPPSEALINGP